MRENFKKTRAVADMQEQSQPPIPRGHCQSRHDKFPHARIAHSGPPITASAPREKMALQVLFKAPASPSGTLFSIRRAPADIAGKTGQTFGTTPHIPAFPRKAQTFMPSIRKSRHLGFLPGQRHFMLSLPLAQTTSPPAPTGGGRQPRIAPNIAASLGPILSAPKISEAAPISAASFGIP